MTKTFTLPIFLEGYLLHDNVIALDEHEIVEIKDWMEENNLAKCVGALEDYKFPTTPHAMHKIFLPYTCQTYTFELKD